jgi:hypothetical protein
MVTRDAIAAALSTVPGITGSAHEPPTKAAGQAWPVWRDSVTLNGCDAVTVNWYVYVVLPAGDLNTPADAADPLVLPISHALHDTSLTVERWEPWQLQFGPDAAIPVLRYTVFD